MLINFAGKLLNYFAMLLNFAGKLLNFVAMLINFFAELPNCPTQLLNVVATLLNGVTKLSNFDGSSTNFPPKLPREEGQAGGAGRFRGGIFRGTAAAVDAYPFQFQSIRQHLMAHCEMFHNWHRLCYFSPNDHDPAELPEKIMVQ